MAGYSFETMSASDAAAFTSGDYLFFISNGATANEVTVAPYSNGSSGSLNGSGITLTFGGKSLVFNNNISVASESGHVLFNDNSHLIIGTDGPDAGAGTTMNGVAGVGGAISAVGNTNTAGMHTDPQTIYALGGVDTVDLTANGGIAANTAVYINGGFGADTIRDGNASGHIYGNSIASQQGAVDNNGQPDGGDTITVGNGSNYVNGNAGADTISAGTAATTGAGATAASTGYNRIFGGADNDTVNIVGNGHNAVNGNAGNDTINDTGFGDNTLRGGMGNDTITGGSGHSVLMGDVGNDTVIVHGSAGEDATNGSSNTGSVAHIDVISGGDGSDTFNFGTAGAGQAALFGQTVYYQEITDFTQGADKLIVPTASMPMDAGDVGHATTVFGSVHDAEIYASSQLAGNGGNGNSLVEALAVGSANNTYLFYAESGNVAVNNSEVDGLGVIHLDGVTASAVTFNDFNV